MPSDDLVYLKGLKLGSQLVFVPSIAISQPDRIAGFVPFLRGHEKTAR